MKRRSLFLCVILILSLLVACAPKSQHVEQPANFYYCTEEITYHSSQGIIKPEVRETITFHSNIQLLLNAYLKGPVSKDLVSPFPADVSVVEVVQDADMISLVLSDEFAKISGVEMTIACSCVSLTIMEFTGIPSVNISIENASIFGKDSLTLTRDKLVLVDASAPVNQAE